MTTEELAAEVKDLRERLDVVQEAANKNAVEFAQRLCELHLVVSNLMFERSLKLEQIAALEAGAIH